MATASATGARRPPWRLPRTSMARARPTLRVCRRAPVRRRMLRGQTARRTWAGRVVLVTALLGGCRDPESAAPRTSQRPAESVRQALNASPKLGDFVLEAGNSIAFQQASSVGTLVGGGDVGARGSSGPFLSGTKAIDVASNVTVQPSHH